LYEDMSETEELDDEYDLSGSPRRGLMMATLAFFAGLTTIAFYGVAGLALAYSSWLVFMLAATTLYFVYGANPYYFQLLDKGLETERAERVAKGMGQEVFPGGDTWDSLRESSTTRWTWVLDTGMGVVNAAVFELVPKYVPDAVGGASGWIGGIGGAGTLTVLPILGVFVDLYGEVGYARGFVVIVGLSAICVVVSILLKYFGPGPAEEVDESAMH
jgi:hypothetical protein